jgi:hypothetical protein
MRNPIRMLALLAVAAGCDVAPEKPASAPVQSSDSALKAELEAAVNAYGRALYDRKQDVLKTLLSREVLTRLQDYEGGVDRFVEKQRASMLKSFKSMNPSGMADRFTINSMDVQAETVAVNLSYGGQEIPRPFYFVKEGGRWTLNVARPGFSQKLPDGSLAASTYMITTNYQSGFASVGCIRDDRMWNWVDLPNPNSNYYLSCRNMCGFWTGGYFTASNWQFSHYCDYNTWGTDVWSDAGKTYCNDGC